MTFPVAIVLVGLMALAGFVLWAHLQHVRVLGLSEHAAALSKLTARLAELESFHPLEVAQAVEKVRYESASKDSLGELEKRIAALEFRAGPLADMTRGLFEHIPGAT